MKDFEVAYRLYKTNEILGHCNTVKGTYNADTKTVVLRMTDATISPARFPPRKSHGGKKPIIAASHCTTLLRFTQKRI